MYMVGMLDLLSFSRMAKIYFSSPNKRYKRKKHKGYRGGLLFGTADFLEVFFGFLEFEFTEFVHEGDTKGSERNAFQAR